LDPISSDLSGPAINEKEINKLRTLESQIMASRGLEVFNTRPEHNPMAGMLEY